MSTYCKKCGCLLKTDAYNYDKYNYYCEDCMRKRQAQTNKQEQPNYHITGGKDGSLIYQYNDGTTVTKTKKQIDRGFRGVVFFLLIAVIGGFLGVRFLMFKSTESKLADSFEITEPMSGDGSDFVNEILLRDNSSGEWHLKITEYPEGYWNTVFKLSYKYASITGYTLNGEQFLKCDFKDDDASTGLESIYYLGNVNGKLSIIDYSKEIIYPEGTEFFNKNYEKLAAFQYDTIIPKLTDGLVGGEYGAEKSDKKVVLKSDKVSASVYDDGTNKTRILDERGDVRVQYELWYFEKGPDKFLDFSTYKVAEK